MKRVHEAIQSFYDWENYSTEIEVVNYHVPPNKKFLTEFMCKALPNATHTCSELQQQQQQQNQEEDVTKKSVNPSENLDYDILAVQAYQNGLVGHSFQRMDVTEKVKTFVQNNKNQNNISLLPQKCFNTTVLNYLYQWSLESEEWALSAMKRTKDQAKCKEIYITPLSEEELAEFNNDWKKSLEDKKICSVDAEQALKQDHWQKFFRDNFPRDGGGAESM